MKQINLHKIFPVLLTLLFFVVCQVPVFASQSIPQERTNPRVTDDAGLLSEADREQLQEKLDEISQRQQADVVVVTTDSLAGKTPEEYADDFYDDNDYGYGDARDGVLFLIAMDERKWHISTCGRGIDAFTDAGIEYIGEKCRNALSDGDYMQAFSMFADLSDEFLTQEADGEAYDVGNMPKEKLSPIWIVIDFAIGFLIMLAIAAVKRSKLKSARFQQTADAYLRSENVSLTRNHDHLINRVVTTRVIPREQNSGGGGGSSTHSSSSGTSHGGGGGSF